MTDLASSTRMGTLQLLTGYPFIQIWYALFKPLVSIDGGPESKVTWGENALSLPEGEHQVTIRTKWYGIIPVGKASTTVTVPADGAVSLRYRAPLFTLFFPGKLTQA